MKAIVYIQYGSPEVLTLADREMPRPASDEVLVRVRAAEATKSDCEMRNFHFPVKWFSMPLRLVLGVRKPKRQILGGYFSGVVAGVGSRVERFQVGDEVFGAAQLRFGAYGEYLTLPERYTLTRKPSNMSFAEAAAVPLGGLNALHFMRLAKLQPGERILINGAGGSIGSFAVQIAKSMGAHVTAVDAAHKAAMLRELGVDAFIDYTRDDFAEGSVRYDVVFDMVVSTPYGKCLGVLKPRGRYLTGNPTVMKMVRSVATSIFTRRSASFAFAGERREELEALRDLIEASKLRAPIDQVLPLEEAAAAHRRVESEERVGIVVLSLAAGAGKDCEGGRESSAALGALTLRHKSAELTSGLWSLVSTPIAPCAPLAF